MSISVSLDKELLREIDRVRGLVKRSNFVEDMVKRGLAQEADS